jgi:hypothetical protein
MKEKFQERLVELRKQQAAAQIRLQQAQNDFVAIGGAIQEIEYQISLLKEENKDNHSV